MATTATGGSIAAAWSCPSSTYFSRRKARLTTPAPLSSLAVNHPGTVCCSAVQESSTTPTVAAETKEVKKVKEDTADGSNDGKLVKKVKEEPADGSNDGKPVKKPVATAAAKAPVKSLPELMEEEIIPSLKATLEVHEDICNLNLAFIDNTLEGSFVKKGIPYTFWAFFPEGTINGPKGFSVSSYGLGVSTVEPFLVDEKKPTSKLVVFWVEKRLAAQGIIPVWQE